MHDAVLVGSGHNNLVAGVVLAQAGWKVAVYERADEPGGAVGTDTNSIPGYRLDAFSNTHVLIFLSRFYHEMKDDLARHGLKYLRYEANIVSLFPDKTAVCQFPDLEGTLDDLGRLSADDAAGWEKLYGLYRDARDAFSTLFSGPIPSLASMEALAGARLRFGPRGNMEFTQLLTMSGRSFAERHFRSEKAKAWFLPYGLHPPLAPESAGAGVFAWVGLAVAQDPDYGLAIPAGGSGSLSAALVSLLRSLGGEVHCGVPVARIIVRGKTAKAIELEDGTQVEAGRAIIAGLAPTKLFGELIEPEALPADSMAKLRHYRYGAPRVKIDYALSRPPSWEAGDGARKAGLVHISPSVDAMSQAANQVVRGYLPGEPLLIVAQPSIIDPSRAPEGKHTLWVLTSVPYEVKGDSAGKIGKRPWLHMKERFADRVGDIIERYAPGFKESVLARHVMSPEDLEAANPNLVRGDISTGSTEFDQSYIFRPIPGWSRYATPISRLYLCGAGTHPGPGVHGMSGWALANMLL